MNETRQYHSAIGLFEEALEINKKVGNAENIAFVENNMGMSYYGLHDFSNAKIHFSNSLRIAEERQITNFFLLATAAGNVHVACDSLGNHAGASKIWLKKLHYYEKMIETNDSYHSDYYRRDCALEYQDLGDLYAEIGDTVQFNACYLKAKQILSNLLSEENVKFADIFLTKGLEEYANGNIDDAEKFLRKALNINMASYGDSKPEVAECYNALGTICLLKKRFSEGEGYADKAVSIMEKLYPQGHNKLYLYYGVQGTFRMRKYEESSRHFAQTKKLEHFGEDECFSKALEMAEKFYPGDTEQIESSVETFVKLYAIRVALGENDYKERMRTLAIKYPKQFKKALDNLQQQTSTQQHQMKQ
jgi:tetratricopeptide (TPR) repeat protein